MWRVIPNLVISEYSNSPSLYRMLFSQDYRRWPDYASHVFLLRSSAITCLHKCDASILGTCLFFFFFFVLFRFRLSPSLITDMPVTALSLFHFYLFSSNAGANRRLLLLFILYIWLYLGRKSFKSWGKKSDVLSILPHPSLSPLFCHAKLVVPSSASLTVTYRSRYQPHLHTLFPLQTPYGP